MEVWKPDPDPDTLVDQLIQKYDEASMPLPDIECEPHLLISKVRKHYMEYVVQLLSINYENHQKLLNKNIYLPSAIWRCAKSIETSAVRACMVVQLYRKNIQNVITELKNDTKKGRLNKKLYECLHRPPENEKKLQTNLNISKDCNCQCTCKDRKKRRRISSTLAGHTNHSQINDSSLNNNLDSSNMQTAANQIWNQPTNDYTLKPPTTVNYLTQSAPKHASLSYTSPPKAAMETPSDELDEQLEKLFHSDPNDDDLFEGTLCSTDYVLNDNPKKFPVENPGGPAVPQPQVVSNTVIDAHEAKIRSLDERVASLAGLLENSNENLVPQIINNDNQKTDNKRTRRHKWLCEEYFLKVRLYEMLDLLRETNRMGHMRIKDLFRDLFGDDSDDEGMLSPLEESHEFVTSCKERIAPWVVKLLSPYYTKGRIRGKTLFKALARHLIGLIYQCSRYPRTREIQFSHDLFVGGFILLLCCVVISYFVTLAMDYRNMNSPNLTNCAINWTPNLLYPNNLATNSRTLNPPTRTDTAMHPDLTALQEEINNFNEDAIEPTDYYEVSSFVSDFLNNHKMIRCEADFKQFKIDNL